MKSFIILLAKSKSQLTAALPVAKWWLGTQDTTSSQLLDGDCSHRWQLLAIQPQAPHGRENKASVPQIKHWKKRQGKV